MKLKIIFLLLSIVSVDAISQEKTRAYCLDDGVGLGGYDPISYFQNGIPKKGEKSISMTYDEVEYYFSTKENRKAFKNNPDKYLPAFGGWCSMTLVMGRATEPVYDNFIIKEGRLYLFERTLSVNGRTLWVQDHDKHKQLAKDNYNQYIETGKIE